MLSSILIAADMTTVKAFQSFSVHTALEQVMHGCVEEPYTVATIVACMNKSLTSSNSVVKFVK